MSAKIQNCRTLLRRNWKSAESSNPVLVDLKSASRRAARADWLPELLGVEGTAAARYFRSFGAMLRGAASDAEFAFDFETRNRRPPKDPVNALLSFAYSLLVRSWTVTLAAVGFDACRGLYHQPRYGRPALALDLMEPFPRGRPPALRLPRQLSPPDGDAGPPVRSLPLGRASRVSQLHDPMIPWSTSTSSSTT